MKKMLFRITRVKALRLSKSLVQTAYKKVYYLVVLSAASGKKRMRLKDLRLFHGLRLKIPYIKALNNVKAEIITKITKSKSLNEISVNQLTDYLFKMNSSSTHQQEGVSTFEIYKCFVAKEKTIYKPLKLLKLHR